MKRATTCKYCKIPLILNIDDAYGELGDEHKLIPMAACNRCADLRVNIRRLIDSVGRLCSNLIQWAGGKNADRRGKVLPILHQVTRKYAEQFARLHNSKRMIWSEDFGLLLWERPEKWGIIIDNYKKTTAREYAQEQRELPQRATHPDP